MEADRRVNRHLQLLRCHFLRADASGTGSVPAECLAPFLHTAGILLSPDEIKVALDRYTSDGRFQWREVSCQETKHTVPKQPLSAGAAPRTHTRALTCLLFGSRITVRQGPPARPAHQGASDARPAAGRRADEEAADAVGASASRLAPGRPQGRAAVAGPRRTARFGRASVGERAEPP
eukprot:5176794-Prymnesium_polylepis.1